MFFKYKYSPDDVIVKVITVLEENPKFFRIVGVLDKDPEEMILYKDSWLALPKEETGATSSEATTSQWPALLKGTK